MFGKNGSRPKILHVDDDRFQREIISLVLTGAGLDFQTCCNGREGVALAREWVPDLILMDIMMPVMDGIEATKLIRETPHTGHIPILGLSSVADAETQAMAASAGMNDLLPKIIVPSQFIKLLQSYLK